MLIVASLATIATSWEPAEITSEHAGESFQLSPDASRVSIPFVFEVPDAQRAEGNWYASFDLTLVWRGVSDEDRRLTYRMVNTGGAEIASGTISESRHLTCRTECIGSSELVIAWPEDVPSGSVTVDWLARAVWSFERRIPDGAELAFRVTDPVADPSPVIIGSGRIGKPASEGVSPVHRQRLDITAPADSVLWLEIPDLNEGSGRAASLRADVGPQRIALHAGDSVKVPAPASCQSPCSWTVDLTLVDESLRYDAAPWALWRLVDASIEPVDATVDAADVRPPSLTATLSGGPMTIGRNDRTSVRLRLEVDREALAVGDFELVAPQVVLSLRTPIRDGSGLETDGRFIRAIDLTPPGGPVRQRDETLYAESLTRDRPLTIQALVECTRNGCRLDFEITFEGADLGRSGVEFEWSVTAELPYPFASDVPERAHMRLEER